MEADVPRAHDLHRRLRQLGHVAEPLERDQGLDAPAGTVRVRDVVGVRLLGRDHVLRAERGHHRVARLVDVQAGEALPRRLGHPPVLADHRDLLEPVAAPDLEVVGVVAGGDLEAAGAELRVHVLVGDHRQATTDQRQDGLAADQVAVALVLGMDGDSGVRQHRLRPDRGDRDRARAVRKRVVDRVERVGDRPLLDLEVGDRRAQPRVPVDHVVVAVDVAAGVQLDEDLDDRAGVGVVHREALVRIVGRRAEPFELADDLRAVLIAPLPHAPHELVPPELEARRPLGLELLLDHRLGADPGVVRAEDPARRHAPHPLEADQGVLDRAVQRVPHVQRAGHVRRGDRDRVVVLRLALGQAARTSRPRTSARTPAPPRPPDPSGSWPRAWLCGLRPSGRRC